MKKYSKIILPSLFGLFFALFVSNAFADETYYLSESTFNISNEVSIFGQNFGDAPGKYGGVCFRGSASCYLAGNPGILYWSDDEIIVRIPHDIPVGGKISVYDFNADLVTELDYKINPVILQISDGEYLVEGLTPGKTLVIDGYGFGGKTGSVLFGERTGEIITWEDNLIHVEVPNYKPDKKEIVVINSASGRSSHEFEILQNFTNDTYAFLQKYLETTKITKAWNLVKPKEDVIVAIIDDGVYQNHPDLEGMIWENSDEIAGNGKDDDKNGYVDDILGWNFVDNDRDVIQKGSHGTTIAGIISSIQNNEFGFGGISNNIKIMPLIVCGEEESDQSGCNDSDIMEAVYYAVDNGAKVINLSLGGETTDGYVEEYNEVIEYAYDNNVVIVAAGGNGDPDGEIGYNLNRVPDSPVCNDGDKNMVLGVGATDSEGTKITNWTNYGDCVDVYTPGENIPSLMISHEDEYTIKDGTSFSAPMVTGLAALIFSEYPDVKNSDIYEAIIETKNDFGLLDAEAAVEKIISEYDPNKEIEEETEENDNEEEEEEEEETNEETDFDPLFLADIENSDYTDAIKELKSKGIVDGYPDGTFKPFDRINRAEFTKIIVGAVDRTPTGSTCFSDLNGEWFAPYVCIAKWTGIIDGYPDGTFKPERNVNVAEALKIVLEAFEKDIRPKQEREQWYERYTEYAEENDLYLPSFSGNDQEITREEMAELIYRIIEED